jgi:hypothetical protein
MTGWAVDHPGAEVSTVDSRQGPVLTTFARVAAGENEAPARRKEGQGVLHPISGSWRNAKNAKVSPGRLATEQGRGLLWRSQFVARRVRAVFKRQPQRQTSAPAGSRGAFTRRMLLSVLYVLQRRAAAPR